MTDTNANPTVSNAPQTPENPQVAQPAAPEAAVSQAPAVEASVQAPADTAAFQAPAPEPVPVAQPAAAPQSAYAAAAPGAAAVPQNVGAAPQGGYAQPAVHNIPGMPLITLTNGMKFGWAAAGFLMGPVAILLAWLTNAHNFPDAKKDAVKFSLFGFLAQFLVCFVLLALFGFMACAAATSAVSGYGYYY